MRSNQSTPTLLPAGIERYVPDAPPELLLIACTDPVLDAHLLPRFCRRPLLVWRSTGPVVPPYGPEHQELAEALDEVLNRLAVKEIAICGHLPNKALEAIVANQAAGEESTNDAFHHYVQSIRPRVQKKHGPLDPDQLIEAITEENIFVQMANLRTYPSVLTGMANGKLRLHSWFFDANEDQLYAHGTTESYFLSRFEEFSQPASRALAQMSPCDMYLA